MTLPATRRPLLHRPRIRRIVAVLIPILALAAVSSCENDPVGLKGEIVSICHLSASVGAAIQVYSSQLPEHQQHGDYFVSLEVDHSNAGATDDTHFARITDALAAARAGRVARAELTTAACPITIEVGPGSFEGSAVDANDPALEVFPLVIDVPDLTLRGSLDMTLDPRGRATGESPISERTTLSASHVLTTVAQLAQTLVVVDGHPDGSGGNGATIEGFVFEGNSSDAPPGGQAILALRAIGLLIQRNRFEGAFSEPMDLRASSARVVRNYLTGRGVSCGICFAGPGEYEASHNRSVGPGGIPGILITPATLIPVPSPVEQYVLPSSALVTALIGNNEISNHQAVPVGVALRIGAIGVGAPNVAGTAVVHAVDNHFTNNRFGIIVEAAFPVANTTLRGDIELTLNGNTTTGSCQNSMLVSFSRHTTGLGLPNQNAPYLRNSTFTFVLGGGSPSIAWSEVWYAHPAGFGNTMTVDGLTIPNGSRVAYDPARVCS